jgi:hypothetical protein
MKVRSLAAPLAPALLTVPHPVVRQEAFPGRTWPTATPASVGLNGSVLDGIAAEIVSATP